MLWNASGTWRAIRQMHRPRAAAPPSDKRPIAIRHSVAVFLSFFLESKPVSGRPRSAKSRA